MTPYTLFREVPTRIGQRIMSWPTFWKVIACSAASMALAVGLTAWQAWRYYAPLEALLADKQEPVSFEPFAFQTWQEIRERQELGCQILEHNRTTGTGWYAPEMERRVIRVSVP